MLLTYPTCLWKGSYLPRYHRLFQQPLKPCPSTESCRHSFGGRAVLFAPNCSAGGSAGTWRRIVPPVEAPGFSPAKSASCSRGLQPRHSPPGLKPVSLASLCGTAEQAAEKVFLTIIPDTKSSVSG